MFQIRFTSIATLSAVFVAAPLWATDLDAPTGEVVLTISGAIAITNVGETARFDRAMLEDLGAVTIRTETIWTEGEQSFTGVPLSRLMDRVAATGDSMNATAVNDYAVSIPREDWVEDGPIVAYLNNGEPMSLRGKGPLWIVYPYDTHPEYQSEVIYSRSIWQLDRIVVEN